VGYAQGWNQRVRRCTISGCSDHTEDVVSPRRRSAPVLLVRPLREGSDRPRPIRSDLG